MDLLVVTDLHFAGKGARSTIAARRGDLVPELLDRLREKESGIDALLCLGDAVENGRHPDAVEDLRALKEKLASFGVPFLAIPGNHDRDPKRFASVFGEPEPLLLPEKVRVIPFADSYDEKDVCTRDFAVMEDMFAQIRPGETVIVCQHNTVLPEIDSAYPYTPVRFREIADAYEKAGVALSLSGHYHSGIEMFTEQGVRWLCGPAFCEEPFRYMRITLDGGDIRVKTLSL